MGSTNDNIRKCKKKKKGCTLAYKLPTAPTGMECNAKKNSNSGFIVHSVPSENEFIQKAVH